MIARSNRLPEFIDVRGRRKRPGAIELLKAMAPSADVAASYVSAERRQLDFAMTRAKRQLTLTMPKASALVTQTVTRLGNRLPPANRSRFIPATLVDLFDEQEA